MRRWMGILLAAGVLLLAGCGNSEKTIDREVQNAAGGGTQDMQQSEAPAAESGALAASVEKGYVFYYKDVMISVDMDIAPALEKLEKLGESVSYFEAPSCAFDGLDKIYTYGSFRIETYPKGQKDYVSMIVLLDDAVSTAENICIGSLSEDVKQAYGTAYTEEGNMLVYEKDGMKLCILLENGAVTSIQYASMVLEE